MRVRTGTGTRWAVAGVPVLLAAATILPPAPGIAFQRSTTDDPAVCLYWPARTLRWHAAQPLGAGEVEERALAAIRAAFRTWEEVTCTDVRLVEGERTDRTVGHSRSGQNRNVVLFRTQASCRRLQDDPCHARGSCVEEHDCWEYDPAMLAVTTVTYDRCGRIRDADIEINGGSFRFTTADGPPCRGSGGDDCVAFDVRGTVTHEVGHLLGLDHPPDQPDATMHAASGEGESHRRDLAQDDIDGVCAIYPAGAPPAACVAARACEPPPPPGGPCHAGSGGASATMAVATAGLLAWLRRRRGRTAPRGRTPA